MRFLVEFHFSSCQLVVMIALYISAHTVIVMEHVFL